MLILGLISIRVQFNEYPHRSRLVMNKIINFIPIQGPQRLIKMKKMIFLVCGVLVLSGCTEFLFVQPVPDADKAIKQIPEAFRGKFICLEDSSVVFSGPDYFMLKNKSGEFQDAGILGEDALLIPYEDHYFFNQKQQKQGEGLLWRVGQLTKTEDGFNLCFAVSDDNDSIAAVIGNITAVKKVLNEEGTVDHYVVDPDKAAFKKLVENQVFSSCFSYRRIAK